MAAPGTPTFHSKQVKAKWDSFVMGLNTIRQPQDMLKTELSDVMNFRFVRTPAGVGLTNRPGMVKMTGTTAITTGAVKDLHRYVQTDGSIKYLAVVNSAAYMSTGGTSPWGFTSLGTLEGGRGRMVTFAGKAIVADGVGVIKKYDGTTWGTCTSTSPKASMLCVHGDRLLANDVSAGKKNYLFYSQLRDPEDWTTSGAAGSLIQTEIAEITALSKFYGLVLIHGSGPKMTMKLSGTTPVDFLVDRAMPGMGAVGPDQEVVLSNDVLFLDSPGLLSFKAWEKFGDIEESIVSEQVGNLIATQTLTNFVMGRHSIDQQVWLWDGSSTYILVYDAQYGAWTKYWLKLGTGVTPTCIRDLDGQLYIGTSDGHVWRMDLAGTVWQDNAVDYDLYFKGPATDYGTILKKQGKWFNTQISVSAGGSANAVLFRDMSASPFIIQPITAPTEHIVGSATGTVGDATYLVDESGGVLVNKRVNFEFKYIQPGMTNCDPNNSRMDVSQMTLEAAYLSR